MLWSSSDPTERSLGRLRPEQWAVKGPSLPPNGSACRQSMRGHTGSPAAVRPGDGAADLSSRIFVGVMLERNRAALSCRPWRPLDVLRTNRFVEVRLAPWIPFRLGLVLPGRIFERNEPAVRLVPVDRPARY